MKSLILGLLIISALIYLIVGVILYFNQRNFIYFPPEPTEHDYEQLVFENDNEFSTLLKINPGNEKAILYFGGNGGQSALLAPGFETYFPGYTVYLAHYRGYEGSSGLPTEEAIFSDALNAYDELAKKYGNLFVVGRSLGSGVATYVAEQRELDKLILVTPFDSIENIARDQFRIYPMSLLLKDKYDSASRAQELGSDVLIVKAETDEVVSHTRTKALIEAFGENKPLVLTIDGSDHGNIGDYEQYHRAIRRFLEAK